MQSGRKSGLLFYMLLLTAFFSSPALSTTAQANIIYSGLLNTTVSYTSAGWSANDDIIFGYSGENVTLSWGSSSVTIDNTAGGFELALRSFDDSKYDIITDWTIEPYASWTFEQAMLYGCTQVKIAGWLDTYSNGYATKLSPGDAIGSGTDWLSLTDSQAGATLVDYDIDESPTNKGSWAFTTSNNDVGYVGLAFLVGGQTYYGWAQISASINQTDSYASYTLIDWAYNGEAGASILAGDTGTCSSAPVPEPATMLLLGIGLFGLAELRRIFLK